LAASKSQPIIIIKKKRSHGGHHGGAWKVAYADFVTAMMSLFIVLWLMNSSEKIKKAVAGYFNDPKGTAALMGTTMTGTGESVTAAAANNMLQLKDKLEQEIKASKELEKLSKQIEITITPEGLRIELLEGRNGTFYQSGSARLSGSGQQLLALLADELKKLPNALLIEGHTDATQYLTDISYSNWELSADRANTARRLLQQDGVRRDQVTQVRGYADQLLRVKNNPADPSNRRISILVKNDHGVTPNVANAKVLDKPLETQKTDTPVKRRDTPGSIPPAASAGKPAPADVASLAKPAAAKPSLIARLKTIFPGAKK